MLRWNHHDITTRLTPLQNRPIEISSTWSSWPCGSFPVPLPSSSMYPDQPRLLLNNLPRLSLVCHPSYP
ncbi:hypothetical protein DSO57_1015476 [Entomophthora muscae]|uniref:Uncharacterized protein n=1 Tax=Entomophthora muscae TaxID=34485 RepID=A0ACC2TG06_9FUNG|nr:hypothetical protein DSO57_1015476 [Entomophthora muscae]